MQPREVLKKARDAAKSGLYEEALENYEYFFDHALDEDPSSFYGVRLSYCLDEWAELGKKYPEARNRLEAKRDESISLLQTTRSPERFHDYVAICDYLDCKDLPVEKFIRIHEHDRPLAVDIVRYIWDQLVQRQLWKICREYVAQPLDKYEHHISSFDQAIAICKSDASLGGDRFEKKIKGWCIRDVSNLLLVLKNNYEVEACVDIMKRVERDLLERSYDDVFEEIQKRIAI